MLLHEILLNKLWHHTKKIHWIGPIQTNLDDEVDRNDYAGDEGTT